VDFGAASKLYPNVEPELRAYAVVLWLSKVTGLDVREMVPEDVEQLPEPRFVSQLLRSEATRIRRSKLAAEFGPAAVARVLMRRTLRALSADAHAAFAQWPPMRDRANDTSPEHTTSRRVFDEAQRAIRSQIAAGQLPASLLATSMEPRRKRR